MQLRILFFMSGKYTHKAGRFQVYISRVYENFVVVDVFDISLCCVHARMCMPT